MTLEGDKIGAIDSLADNAFLLLQPPSTEEWTIHNLHWNGSIELYFTDGSNDILDGSSLTSGARLNNYLNCRNNLYYKLKNISGDTLLVGYDGVATKVTV